LAGVVACFFTRSFHRWRSDEIAAFDTLGEALGIESTPATNDDTLLEHKYAQQLGRYQRLADHGNIVILTTDAQFTVIDVFGNTLKLIGVPREEVAGASSLWQRIVDPRDIASLGHKITRLRIERGELKHELRVRHQVTGVTRWVFLRALPRFDTDGAFLGWEGFGVDVTDRVEAQEAYLDRSRRLEALLEITRAMEGHSVPVAVALTGLKALIRATQAECGFASFVERESSELELVATVGLSENFLSAITPVLKGPSLLRDAVDSHESFMLGDLQRHPRATHSVALNEGLHSTIMVPMLADGRVHGALMIFKRADDSFCDDDLEFAEAAASQITVVLRKAELLHGQRRQSASLSSLYKVSREMAKYRSQVDFSREILPVMRSEFALRRGWIGLMNESGSFIFGKAGFTSDAGNEAAEIQFTLEPGHSALHHVLKTHTPLLVQDPRSEIGDPLRSFFSDATSLVVAPMVTVGQTMGILVLEPLSSTTFASSERLQLLVAMTNEIATAMMAGRFEIRAADSHKMRMASLLASGVAHNFNNLLQAIVGQVSLIEMRTKADASIRESTQTINHAAQRGASLVSQLLQFATKGTCRRRSVQLAEMLSECEASYREILGEKIALTIECQASEGTMAYIDSSQVQEALHVMLRNARDAIGTTSDGEVLIAARPAVVRAGELGPDVSPGSYVRIDVQDNGIGMGPEQQARCFEPFFTTKNIDSDTGVGLTGSGLGLSGAYAIIKQHDGYVSVHSKVGEGAVFSIYLPRGTAAHDEGMSTQGSHAAERARPGVLLLGVDAGTQPFIVKTLESLGYESRAVFDVRQIKDMLSANSTAWSYILIDEDTFAEKDSAACSRLALQFPGMKVVTLTSGATGTEHVSNPPSMDRVRRLLKPLTVWSLEAALRQVEGEPTS
jgi:PAS domain S-box-containing protein